MAFLFRGRPLACAGGLPRQLFAQGARLARQAPARPRRFELSTLPQLAWRHAPAAGPALLGDVPAWRGRRRSPAGRRALSTAPDDPYKLLGVTRGLNDHEYKVAYLKRARECHPDLHPNDPRGAPASRQATARFQSLSAAFELIKDSGKRAAFNARPRYSQAHHTSYQQQADPAGDAAATWAEAFDDVSAMWEAAQEWWKDECVSIDGDAKDFAVALQDRRLGDAWEIGKRYSAVLLGIALPALLILRWPHAAMVLLRGAVPIMTFVIGGLARLVIRNPRMLPVLGGILKMLGGGMWQRAVSRARIKIAEKRRQQRRAEKK